MKRIYSENDQYVIVEENGKFGIEDKSGNALLPIEYDSISSLGGIRDGVTFILCRNGRFGFVELGNRERLAEDEYGVVLGAPNGCALAFLPCLYARIEATRNGLVLYQTAEGGEQRFWYDFASRTLHRDLCWLCNYGAFDSFLIDGSGMPTLKKAGKDAWVKFPKDSGAEPWREIPLSTVGVRCILYLNELADDDCLYEYFFVLLYKNGWMPTPAKRTLAELYADLPAMMEGIDNAKNNKNENTKQVYSLLCQYKKKNEEWN